MSVRMRGCSGLADGGTGFFIFASWNSGVPMMTHCLYKYSQPATDLIAGRGMYFYLVPWMDGNGA
jgi:hypothetical protein